MLVGRGSEMFRSIESIIKDIDLQLHNVGEECGRETSSNEEK